MMVRTWKKPDRLLNSSPIFESGSEGFWAKMNEATTPDVMPWRPVQIMRTTELGYSEAGRSCLALQDAEAAL